MPEKEKTCQPLTSEGNQSRYAILVRAELASH